MTLRDPTHLFEGEVSEGKLRFAKIASDILQPTMLSIPVFLLLCLKADDINQYAICAAISLFFAVVFPMIEIYAYARYKGTEGDIPNREDRFIPLVLGTVSYIFGCIGLYLVKAPDIVLALMVAYAVNTIVITFISFRWKISIHAIGVVGPTMALTYAFGPIGLLLILLLPLIMWCRYVLRKHTPAQLVCGALLGFVLTMIVFVIMLPIMP